MRKRMSKVGMVAFMALVVTVSWHSTGMVARLSGQATTPAGSPAASPAASPVDSPITAPGDAGEIVVDPASSRFPVAGNAFRLLEAGTPGELSLVAHGPVASVPGGQIDVIPVIVRNNTDAVQVSITVGAEARDANGNLIGAATGRALSPPVVEPGALAMGNIYFESPLPEGATVMFYPPEGGGDAAYSLNVYEEYSGMELTEFSVFPERVLGTVRSTGDVPVERVDLYIACFDTSGTFIAVSFTKPAHESLGPGELSAFEERMEAPCDSYLVTGATVSD